jgi:hypothetical protein
MRCGGTRRHPNPSLSWSATMTGPLVPIETEGWELLEYHTLSAWNQAQRPGSRTYSLLPIVLVRQAGRATARDEFSPFPSFVVLSLVYANEKLCRILLGSRRENSNHVYVLRCGHKKLLSNWCMCCCCCWHCMMRWLAGWLGARRRRCRADGNANGGRIDCDFSASQRPWCLADRIPHCPRGRPPQRNRSLRAPPRTGTWTTIAVVASIADRILLTGLSGRRLVASELFSGVNLELIAIVII